MSAIPPRNDSQNASLEAFSTTTLLGGAAEVQQGTVLVIEDEASVRRWACRALSEAGYQVMEAEDGEAGLRMVHQYAGQIDLVLTDVEMPKLDGVSVAREIAAKHPGIGVVCMSGGFEATTFQSRSNLPLLPFLAKPFTADALAETAAATIARFRFGRQQVLQNA